MDFQHLVTVGWAVISEPPLRCALRDAGSRDIEGVHLLRGVQHDRPGYRDGRWQRVRTRSWFARWKRRLSGGGWFPIKRREGGGLRRVPARVDSEDIRQSLCRRRDPSDSHYFRDVRNRGVARRRQSPAGRLARR